MKPRRTKDPNPLVQVAILRERLKCSLMREQRKSKALNAMRKQLLMYARDLKRVLDQEPDNQNKTGNASLNDGHHKSELTAAWSQLLLYARDLKVIVDQERKNGKDLQKAASVLKHQADLQKNRSGM